MNIDKFKFLQNDGRLERTGWTVKASRNNLNAYTVLDGDPTTKWNTAHQDIGDFLMIDMTTKKTFNKITLEQKPNDHPRGYDVYVSMDGINFSDSIAYGAGTPDTTTTEITFPPQTARYVKIVLTVENDTRNWTVYDVNVWSIQSLT